MDPYPQQLELAGFVGPSSLQFAAVEVEGVADVTDMGGAGQSSKTPDVRNLCSEDQAEVVMFVQNGGG